MREWFRKYLEWLTTHPYGKKERVHPNNHGIAWALQAAAFARLTDDANLLAEIRHWFKSVFLFRQMGADGGFPTELARTKPYGYSLFTIDLMAYLHALDQAS